MLSIPPVRSSTRPSVTESSCDVCAAQTTMEFLPPLELCWIGSYALNTMTMENPIVDLAVRIPDGCFPKGCRDYQQHQYHAKRTLYLQCMAKKLVEEGAVESCHFRLVNNDPRRLVLDVVPKCGISIPALRYVLDIKWFESNPA